MRYRIDGVLYEMVPPPKHIAVAIASRIKVMANLDIAERRLPQDGRIELSVDGNPVDLRVSVLPTMFGESVVMRVLDRSNVKLDLDQHRPARGRPARLPPAHRQAQRHRHRHRPDRLGQDHHAVLGPAASSTTVDVKILTSRGPGRVRHRRPDPGARSTPTSA